MHDVNGGRILHTLSPSNASYSLKGNHYSVRKVLCCCLAAGLTQDSGAGAGVDGTLGGLHAGMVVGPGMVGPGMVDWVAPAVAQHGQRLARCVFDAYDLCPDGDPACAATRPSGAMGERACSCGRFHFGQVILSLTADLLQTPYPKPNPKLTPTPN